MVRRYEPEETKRGRRVVYWLAVAAIIAVWIWAFKSYFNRYEYLHPEITWATPYIDRQIININGLLLWKENVLTAPSSGVVSYPLGRGPVRVARGAVVAKVGRGSVKAYQQGYFVAGGDGQEASWRYATLWSGNDDAFSRKFELQYAAEGKAVVKGTAIGKLIEQPQDLRFVGYAPVRGDVAEQIKNKRLRVRIDAEDTDSTAEVRVSRDEGDKKKIYVTLPWFPPELVMSRNYNLIVDAGQTKGALVPMSSVVQKEGERGVYTVRGARVVFVPVEGKILDNGKFLVTKGISVGDAIVEDASAAREGRIQLW